jgi:hypothetical protein
MLNASFTVYIFHLFLLGCIAVLFTDSFVFRDNSEHRLDVLQFMWMAGVRGGMSPFSSLPLLAISWSNSIWQWKCAVECYWRALAQNGVKWWAFVVAEMNHLLPQFRRTAVRSYSHGSMLMLIKLTCYAAFVFKSFSSSFCIFVSSVHSFSKHGPRTTSGLRKKFKRRFSIFIDRVFLVSNKHVICMEKSLYHFHFKNRSGVKLN